MKMILMATQSSKTPDQPTEEVLRRFKEYLKGYYAVAQQQSGSIYGAAASSSQIIKDVGFDNQWWMLLIKEETVQGMLDLLHPKSAENVLKQLATANRIYASIKQPIDLCIRIYDEGGSLGKVSPETLRQLGSSIYDAFRENHKYYNTFSESTQEEGSLLRDRPGFNAYSAIAVEDVITDHIATAIYSMIGIYDSALTRHQSNRVELVKQRAASYFAPVISFLASGGLEKSRAYLVNLPQEITLANAVSFKTRPQEAGIPAINYNLNGSIAEALMNDKFNTGSEKDKKGVDG